MALPAEEIEELLNLDMINDRAWTIMACSASTGEGLSDGLMWIMKNVDKWLINISGLLFKYEWPKPYNDK